MRLRLMLDPVVHYCTECGEPCTISEETFDYAGTHCTHGRSGTHHTGHYLSDCCFAEYTDEPLEGDEDEHDR